MSKGNIEKLPKWAREELRLLRRDCAYWEEEARKLTIGGVTDAEAVKQGYAFAYTDGDFVPTPHRIVRFQFGNDQSDFIDFRCDNGIVHVSAGFGRLRIEPRAANAVEIRSVK